MKIVSDTTFTEQDIRETLSLASFQLPIVARLPNKFTIHTLKVGPTTHCFLADESRKKFVGAASVMRDAIPFLEPSVKGVRIFQTGLLKEYRGLGFIWRVIDLLSQRYRVFAGPSMTMKGKTMWMKRITYDHKHVYLLTNPTGLYSPNKNQVMMFLPVHDHNIKEREKLAWDGSLKTRLIMVNKSDIVLRRYNIDIKND